MSEPHHRPRRNPAFSTTSKLEVLRDDAAEAVRLIGDVTSGSVLLLTGDRPEPTYLVTKPFQEATVRAAISQALFFHPSRQKEAA